MTTGNIVTWATRLNIVDWVYSKTQILLATLRTQNQLREGILCIFGSRTFVPISWMCKKQASVSHSSTESEIISLDAGLRMDGLLAFDVWDVVIEVLRSTNNTTTPINPATGNRCETGNCSRNTSKLAQKGNREVDQLLHVEYVPTNAHGFQGESQLHNVGRQRCSYQDDYQRQKSNDETRVKNQKSCNYLVCLEESTWTQGSKFNTLTPRTNLPISTEGKLTHDEWYHLLYLLDIMNFPMF